MIVWEILQKEYESLSIFLLPPPSLPPQASQPRRTKKGKSNKSQTVQVKSSSVLNRELGTRVPWVLETINLNFLHLSPVQSPWLSPGRANKIPIFLQPHTLTILAGIQQL